MTRDEMRVKMAESMSGLLVCEMTEQAKAYWLNKAILALGAIAVDLPCNPPLEPEEQHRDQNESLLAAAAINNEEIARLVFAGLISINTARKRGAEIAREAEYREFFGQGEKRDVRGDERPPTLRECAILLLGCATEYVNAKPASSTDKQAIDALRDALVKAALEFRQSELRELGLNDAGRDAADPLPDLTLAEEKVEVLLSDLELACDQAGMSALSKALRDLDFMRCVGFEDRAYRALAEEARVFRLACAKVVNKAARPNASAYCLICGCVCDRCAVSHNGGPPAHTEACHNHREAVNARTTRIKSE